MALTAVPKFAVRTVAHFLFASDIHSDRYAADLAKIMKKSLLIGQVSSLARELEDHNAASGVKMDARAIRASSGYLNLLSESAEEEASTSTAPSKVQSAIEDLKEMDEGDGNFVGADLTDSQRMVLEQALGAWEEPEMADKKNVSHWWLLVKRFLSSLVSLIASFSLQCSQGKVKISDIIQFRASLSYLNTSYPFGIAFGPAENRQNAIESTERVYDRLLLNSQDGASRVLHFDVLALLAVQPDGTLDVDKLKDLIRLFRPDRQGNLTLIDFAKSVDAVYKELRLLRAAVANSSRLDKAFEKILNIIFYFFLVIIILPVLGVDPWVLFASISGFILGFAFMIGRYVLPFLGRISRCHEVTISCLRASVLCSLSLQ